jgi:heptosyltransferase-2
MVMIQPLIAKLKQQDPKAMIHLLAPEWSVPLAKRMPGVDHWITMPFGHGVLNLVGRYRFARSLAKKNFDQAFVLPNSLKSALIPFFAQIPKRTGYVGEMRYGLLNDLHRLNKTAVPRLVDRYFNLVSTSSSASAPSLNSDPIGAKEALLTFNLNVDKPILVLCPGAAFGTSKRWPMAYYTEVAQHYINKGWQVWVFASKDDPSFELKHEYCYDLSGRTSLSQVIDLISLSQAVLTNDSGLMHIASSLSKPLLALYGSTDPGYTPPLGAKSLIARNKQDCSPCFQKECPLKHHRCMQDLVPKMVIAQLESLGL